MFFGEKGIIGKEDNHGDEHVTLESTQMMNESMMMSYLTEEEQVALLESHQEISDLVDSELVTEATIVRLDKNARVNQLQKMAIFTIAKEKNDPLFKKLLTIWRMEKNLEGKLFTKYGSEGLRRARKNVQKNYRQKGKTFAKINDRASNIITKVTSGKGKPSTMKKK